MDFVELLNDACGIEASFQREVLPHAPNARLDSASARIGHEISFARHIYRPKSLRTLAEVREEPLNLERETEGLSQSILGATA